MTARERLKHALKIAAGTAPSGPDDAQLNAIIQDISNLQKTRVPTKADWIKSTHQHVPTSGKYSYAGEDMSDLNALLMQILASPTPGMGGAEKK